MIRFVFVVFTMILGLSVAMAQEDPIKERKALMKANGAQAKIGAAMIKGEKPFDLAAAQKIFATFENAAAKMPALFPDSSKSEANDAAADHFKPSPKIWENMADFKARFVKFGEDAKAAAASVKDVDTLKAAFGNIGKNDCASCHQAYRLKSS